MRQVLPLSLLTILFSLVCHGAVISRSNSMIISDGIPARHTQVEAPAGYDQGDDTDYESALSEMSLVDYDDDNMKAAEPQQTTEQPTTKWARFKTAVWRRYQAMKDKISGMMAALRRKQQQMSQAIKRLFQRKKQSDTAADQKDYASATHLDLSSLPSRSPAVEQREETNQPIETLSPMAAVSPIASASNRRLPLLTDEERQRARWLIAEHARKSLSMPHENPQIPSHYTSRHENIQNRGDHLSNQARDLGSTAEEFAGLALDLRRKVEDEITSRRERL